MLGQREMTAEDVTGILRRGWLYILIPFLLCPLLALGVAYLLPAKYTSEALVMIEQQKVPDSVVKSVVQQNLIARVTSGIASTEPIQASAHDREVRLVPKRNRPRSRDG